MNVFIMRGIQGAGKSTYAKNNLPNDSIICSADSFRMQNGIYVYKSQDTENVHNNCLNLFATSLIFHPNRTLVVDNTNINTYDFLPYYKLSQAFNKTPQIILLMTDPNTAYLRNTHNVPENTIQYLYAKLMSQTIPFPQKVIFPTHEFILPPYQNLTEQDFQMKHP